MSKLEDDSDADNKKFANDSFLKSFLSWLSYVTEPTLAHLVRQHRKAHKKKFLGNESIKVTMEIELTLGPLP